MIQEELLIGNGNVLQLYPSTKNLTQKLFPPSMREDLTGKTRNDFITPRRRFFFNHAFLLWDNREKIYTDSRLFLSTVYMGNGILYAPNDEARYPVLGALLEWWEQCDKAHFVEEGQEKLLVCFQGQTPSGWNRCDTASRNGNIEGRWIPDFWKLWRSFTSINTRYCAMRGCCEAYTLEEVVERISSN